MIQVHFRTQDGSVTSAVGTDGDSVMEIARNNGVHGIVAECGGAAMCATCHVYVSPGWLARIPPMSEF